MDNRKVVSVDTVVVEVAMIAWAKVQRAIKGDAFATESELAAILADPWGWCMWREVWEHLFPGAVDFYGRGDSLTFEAVYPMPGESL